MKEVKQQNKKPLIFYYGIILLIIIVFNMLIVPLFEPQITTVDYGTFITMTEEKLITEVQIEDNRILFADNEKKIYETGILDDPNLVERLNASGAKFGSTIIREASFFERLLLNWILPIGFFIIIGNLLSKLLFNKMNGSNSMSFNMGKSNAKIYVKSDTGIKFKDVAGEDEAKESLQEIVSFLHDNAKYTEIGAVIPKGVLLVGPPGTGKTMLAKAVAGEANVPFFSISGSEFVEMFVGMGAAKVRDLFKQAKEKAPCIIFIDEIDAIGKRRDFRGSSNDEREQTLNQLLTEMDGFDGSKGVVILAATNRPEALDQALTRPGRFDRRIPVELPDLIGREAILKVHAKKIKCDKNIDFNKIARMASGASGAELANIINEAALGAVKHQRPEVIQSDLEEAIEVVIAGHQKKNAILTSKERLIVAYHEVGHALVAAMQTQSAPVEKITIIPRTKGALGYTMQVDQDNKYLLTKEELYNKIVTYTAGRMAEEIVFNSITTGAHNDIQQATNIARLMVTQYGMTDDFGMVALADNNSQYLGNEMHYTCSNELQAEVDKKIISIIKKACYDAKTILLDNKDKMDLLAKELYEKETLTKEEFNHILGF